MVEYTMLDEETEAISSVKDAVKDFAEALSNSPQFQAFEQAYMDFRQDGEAQSAYQELSAKQESLRALMMLKAVSEDDQLALQGLQEKFNQHPKVANYLLSQTALMDICQLMSDQLSDAIGLNYGSICRRGGCCG